MFGNKLNKIVQPESKGWKRNDPELVEGEVERSLGCQRQANANPGTDSPYPLKIIKQIVWEQT
ncbi:MAG: hypothetical protein A2458_01840 [Candidatus Kerfeldbacteria bacterium RIFOXYC2_FULL_38_9]|nr:MAG: hypothetical protein A2458_01840 [Candidatus Kerfeldbacteria bacterium RIFOXYC2_FULL_38_9]